MPNSQEPQRMYPPTDDGSRLRSLLRAIALYIEARGRLFQIEAQEAGTHLISIAVIAGLLVGFLFFALLLILPALVWMLAEAEGWKWTNVAMGMGGFLLLLGGVMFLALRSRLGSLKVFDETFHQFKKDREWISGHPND